MLKSFSESIYRHAVDTKTGRVIYSKEQRDEILYFAKRVRTKDYIVELHLDDGQIHTETFTTTANWYFVLTGAAVLCEENTVVPNIGVKFQNFYPTSPFGTEAEQMNDVDYNLCFGRENKSRFEEYKNLYYSLGQRFTVNVEAFKDANAIPSRVFVVLTGVEFNLEECE